MRQKNMFNGILRLTAAAVCAACVVIPASAEQLYSWTDDNGVTHYSSLPPTNIETKKAYDTIDTTFTPSEREANRKFREQQKQNSADAAAAEESKKLWVQRCKDLANDKVRFSERRINDTYFANVSKCVDSSSGDTDEIKEQRRQCIMKAKQQRDKEFADLPSPEDCEASSAGTKSDSPEADAGKEASAKAAPSKAAPKKKK
ncbi:MAG: DUF4124 domain-containing protein [Succinivibrionaceae bacterium]|jgi:hypothetical protein|nr:DUF4124 domain-containing protein [Succinivibrionaceae bacterium]MDD6546169.1 DUF4124 domain-containing protein [Pseudomonadota bacterium]MDY6274125.1 DUF4124 domain-containing protein [Succinivibrionaceae bacterium]MDY6335566.1 DUF4124 domain-containing protein [Succinivibrionaceae bacterium]